MHTCLFFRRRPLHGGMPPRATPQHCNQALFNQAFSQDFPWHEGTFPSAWHELGLYLASTAAHNTSYSPASQLDTWSPYRFPQSKKYLLTGLRVSIKFNVITNLTCKRNSLLLPWSQKKGALFHLQLLWENSDLMPTERITSTDLVLSSTSRYPAFLIFGCAAIPPGSLIISVENCHVSDFDILNRKPLRSWRVKMRC